MDILVTKRDGSVESLQLDKIHRVVTWAAENLENVSVSQVELKAQLQFNNNSLIKTESIHETLIKSAADLISPEEPNYQYLAARLAIFHLRKKAYGEFTPPPLEVHVKKLVELGFYDPLLLQEYTSEEFAAMDAEISHQRDMNFSYAAVKQLEGKYLIQDRVTHTVYESPQFAYMLIGASLFMNYGKIYNKEVRLNYIKKFYNLASTFKISLPTPIMSGARTKTRQYSSCVLIETDDNLDSIYTTAHAIGKYVSQRAGIGIGAGAIRALGSSIRGGEAVHTGVIPFYKHFQTAVKSCSQGGVRGGAATLFYPLWHLEVESLLVLKNNKGIDENRVRHLDYGIQLNKLMYERLRSNSMITLFSPNEVPGLYEAFFADQEEFEKLYVKYEKDPTIRKKQIPAKDLFSILVGERASTGRIYIMHVDHVNTHGAFLPEVAPVRQSNLCMEITLPTKPLTNIKDTDGEIALCTLSAFNLGEIDSLTDLEESADIMVRALDQLLDIQDYPVLAAQNASMSRRTLGVGVTNYAYYLAKNGVKYSDGSANALTHRTFEAMQYYLLKASNQLAKEFGKCSKFNETTYSKGILPIDTYKKDLDAICNEPLHYDWEALREEIVTHGLRNSTLSAIMPCETSSQITNSTNGIEPPRGYVSIKSSKEGALKIVVPEFERLRDQYELLWDIKDNTGYLQLVGIMQKFIDQSISANTNYDPNKFTGGRVPLQTMLKDLMISYKLGVKTLYYHNTRDEITEEDDCVACKL